MKNHTFLNSAPLAFDSDCLHCGGKLRDSQHGPSDEARGATQGAYHERGSRLVQINRLGIWHGYIGGNYQETFTTGEAAALQWLEGTK